MKRFILISGLCFLIYIIILGARSQMKKQLKPGVTQSSVRVKLQVKGFVQLYTFRNNCRFRTNLQLRVNSNWLRNAKVVAEGHTVPELNPGHYWLSVSNYLPASYKQIEVKISFPSPAPSTISNSRFVRAYVTTGPLLNITKPKADAKINLTRMRGLVVSWTPISTPVKLSVWDRDKSGPDARIYMKDNILKNSMVLPVTMFSPGKKYSIGILTNYSELKFKGSVTPDSYITFSKTSSVWFETLMTKFKSKTIK